MEINPDFRLFVRGFALLSIVMLITFAISGCVQSTTQGTPSDAMAEKTGQMAEGQSIDNSMAGNTTMDGQAMNDEMKAENKSGFEKTQQEVANVVADGTYSKNVTYAYHNGTETIDVTLVVKGDVVESASIIPTGTPHPYSEKLINDVNAALPDLVVGKKIDELDIPANVAGSSLTTAAFKNYVQEVIDTY